MSELFSTVLAMSLGAGIAALAVLALRAVLRRVGAPRLACYLLWAVVLFRMVCPVAVERPWAVLPDLTAPVERAVRVPTQAPAPVTPTPGDTVEYERVPIPNSAPSGTVEAYAVKNPPQQAAPPAQAADWLAPLSLVWAVGALGLWGWAGFSYLRLRRRLRAAVWSEGGVWESDRVPGPCVLGFLPPKIYLPPGLDERTRRYVVLHERTHIRRGDPIVKAVSFLALCLHWFNPLLWLAWALACRDMEGSCDEAVLRQSPPEAKAAYSAALLSLAPVRPARIPLAFGESGVKERIRNVLRWRRPVTAVVAICAVLVAGACAVLGATGSPLPEAVPALSVEAGPNDAFYAASGDTPWEDVPLVSADAAVRLRFHTLSDAPDAWAVTDYLLDGSQTPPAQTLESGRPTASIGVFSLSPHPASTGVGAEIRGIEVACTWRSGVRRAEHRYRFRLLVPAYREGVVQPAPVVLAGGRQIPVSGGGDFSALVSDPVYVPCGGQVLVSCAVPGATDWTLTRCQLDGGGGIAWEYRSESGSFDADGRSTFSFQPGTEDMGLVGAELNCAGHTWQFVFQSDEAPPFPMTWADAAPLLPVPAEWADQDLAGRNTTTSLTEIPDVERYLYDWLSGPNYGLGWAAFSISRGVAGADTYVYRTENLGRTWTEVGHPTDCWHPTCLSFAPDGLHGVLGTGYFYNAPVYATADGGETWQALELPLPPAAGVWEAYDARLGAEEWGYLKLRDTGDESRRVCLVTRDGGLTWTQDFPVANPEELGPDTLPTAYPSGPQWYDVPVRLLAQLPEADIALYGLNGALTPWDGLLVRRGDHLDYFDLFYNPGPRITLADLALGDFDGDGAEELAAVVTAGTGTGTNVQNLYVFEPHWQGFTLAAFISPLDYAGGAGELPRSVFTDLGLPDNYGVGAVITFRGEGDELRSAIGVEDTDYPHTTTYVGELDCAVDYDGRSLALKEFQFISETP